MSLTKREFIRYVGLILGTSGTYVALGGLGFVGWPALIPAFIVGLGLGWVFESQYDQLQIRSKD